MKLLLYSALAIASLFGPLCATASAQIVPVGPFTGANDESFEQLASWQTECYPLRILEGTADLCAPGGKTVVAGTAHCSCPMQPIGTMHAMASNGGHMRITFGSPARRFGGQFGLNCSVPDGRADFHDETGALIASLPLTIPADCTYRWYGFEVVGGPPIASVELISNLPTGVHLLVDDLQVDYVASIDTYCTAKMNSLNCFPRIECDGVPLAGATSGFTVRAVNVIPGGIPGLLLYTVGGTRNAAPFQCGTLCVGPTGLRRSVGVQSTPFGTLCQGLYEIDLNAFASGAIGGNPSAGLSIPGMQVNCQWWGRDQGFPAPCNSTISDALEFVIQ